MGNGDASCMCSWCRDAHADCRTAIADRERRIAQYDAALRACFNAMVMQERRESGEFHIGQTAARMIWDEAKQLADAALATPPTKDETHG